MLTGQETTPQQTSYAYDFENRLNQLQYTNIPNMTGTQTDSLVYNGEGLRTQAVLNSVAANYLYDGSNVLVERDGSNATTKTYTRGLDLGGGIGSLISQNYTANSTAITQYYDYNDLGSAADLTTSAGASAVSYNYDAFGNLLAPQVSGDTNRYLFSTKEFDSRSGLGYFGERYYDPEIGRWLTPDPLGYTDGMNLYAYCHDNPVNCVDPSGLLGERILNGINDFFQNIDFNSLAASTAAIPVVGEVAEATDLAVIEAEQAATGYRYVGSSEAELAQNGVIPNVDQFGQPRNIFYTTDESLNSGNQAQTAYNLSSTPTYRLEFNTNDITNLYGGNVEGGTGTELVTTQTISGKIKVVKLSQ